MAWIFSNALVSLNFVLLSLFVLGQDSLTGTITTSRPYLIDSQVVDIQWVNQTGPNARPNGRVVFVRSAQGSIYRSVDDGKNWVSQREQMMSDEEEPYQARIQQMIFSKAHPHYAVMRGYGEHNWFSKDQGNTYVRHDFGNLVEVRLHAKNPEFILASKYEGGFPNRFLSLFLSTDFGESWRKLVSNVYQFEWADPAAVGVEERSIFACVRKQDAPAKTGFVDWDPNIDFVVSHDFFSTSSILIPHGNRFAVHPPYWFVAAMNPVEELEVKLWVSADAGGSFKATSFPYQLSERSYRVVDSKEGSVFIQVAHGERDRQSANVYMSGPDGRRYTLSLRRVIKDFKGVSDFERINGADGVYVANVVDSEAAPEPATFGAALQGLIFGVGGDEGGLAAKSLITFDKGALWQPLKAPARDSVGTRIDCEGCSLHINGKTSGMFGPVYSSAASTGLILATGNVGRHLRARQDEVNTYFSRDAGRTWEEVRKGSYIYEFGDHGALMLMADNMQATTEILYSWNEGLNWTAFSFWKHHVEVENIITEPSGNSQIFILYGRRNDKGVLMQLDFATLHERRCAGSNVPGSDISDYEEWTPADALRDGSCLLGRKVTYTRRKREVRCFNGFDYDRVEARVNCPCTRADYECDFGYQVNDKKECERVPEMPLAGLGPPEQCAGFFTVSHGYRRVPGDSCAGGEAQDRLEPRREGCPGMSRTALLILMVMLSLAAVTAVVTYMRRKDLGLAEPWAGLGECWEFARGMAESLVGSGPAAHRYRGLSGNVDLDDDFGLGDDDEEAQMLSESLHEYALGALPAPTHPSASPSPAAAASAGGELVRVESPPGPPLGGLPTAPVPSLSPPPPPPRPPAPTRP